MAMIHLNRISGTYYVTDQSQSTSSPQGKSLTEMGTDDWTAVVQKGIQIFGKFAAVAKSEISELVGFSHRTRRAVPGFAHLPRAAAGSRLR